MAQHWQKKALLVRRAIENFKGFLDHADIVELACHYDVESRLILRDGQRWQVQFGPFKRTMLRRLPAKNWTLLIQGVNLHFAEGANLLARFDFIPYARLDDLMVSYAVTGGGVGPHFDAYDVFLLQGFGTRRWQVSQQRDLELKPNLPLKILRRFRATQEWDLGEGDMLYLPPRYAHNGIAIDTCTTYSIGFRAPDWRALGARFFEDVAERQQLDGRYADPNLAPAAHPAKLPTAMIDATFNTLKKVRWSKREIGDFLGRYLSEPKPNVFFNAPSERMTTRQFEEALALHGARLALQSLMLYSVEAVFLNGEATRFPRGVPEALRRLANARALAPCSLREPISSLLKDWHDSGFLLLGYPRKRT